MFTAKDFEVARAIKPGINLARLDPSAYAWLKIAQNANSGSTIYNATIENGIATFGGVVASSPLVSLKLNIPVTQTGSGTPSPTNIRDFVGVTGAVISRTGKNLFNGQNITENSYITPSGDVKGESGWSVSDYIHVSANTIYTFTPNSTAGLVAYNAFYDSNKNLLGVSITRNFTFTTPNNCKFVRLSFRSSSYDIQLELGSTATPYEPYTGNTYQITFGQTVYSAILDALTGLLTVSDDYEIRTIDENSNLTVSNGIFALDNFFDIEGDTDSIMCNVYQRGTNQQNTSSVMTNNPDYSFCCRSISTRTRLMIKDTRFETVEDYKTWLENNPVKIYVKKANPQPYTIQLTPTVINTLIGENVIFADVADVTECKFTRK